MRINWLWVPMAAIIAGGLGFTGSAAAEEPKLMAVHGDWKTYSFTEKGSKTCYALAQPKDSLPKNVRRDDIYLLVTNKQKPKIKNEISVITGYQYKKGSVTTAAIGSDKFNMYTKGDGAWIDGNTLQNRMISAMKRGSAIIVKGTSWRGTLTTDNYSLVGVTAALKEIGEACK